MSLWLEGTLLGTGEVWQAPLDMATVFHDDILKEVEEDISHNENKAYSSSSGHKRSWYNERWEKSSQDSKSRMPAGETIGSHVHGKKRGRSSNYST